MFCRYRFPKRLRLAPEIDVARVIHLERNDKHINSWNNTLAVALQSNHDIAFIPTKQLAFALIYYMTNYSTKDDLQQHQVILQAALLKQAMEAKEASAHGAAGEGDKIANFALRVYNRLSRKKAVSGVTIANHLLRQSDHFESHPSQRPLIIYLDSVR